MRNVDVIIISDAKNESLEKVTRDCLESLFRSEENIHFKAYVVESAENVDYSNIHDNIFLVPPSPPFGYHKYLNLGVKASSSEFVCLCNNDLIFHKNWASAIITEMEKDPNLLSASPISENPHISEYGINSSEQLEIGYESKRYVAGWCIFQRRSIYKKIGKLDERYDFWYCDDDYGQLLEKKQIKHALIHASRVDHVSGQTLKTIGGQKFHAYTHGSEEKFKEKWEYSFGKRLKNKINRIIGAIKSRYAK